MIPVAYTGEKNLGHEELDQKKGTRKNNSTQKEREVSCFSPKLTLAGDQQTQGTRATKTDLNQVLLLEKPEEGAQEKRPGLEDI